MAFGIDDMLTTAAADISLTDTLVKTVQTHRKKGAPDVDLEQLIEAVRVTLLQRIDEADLALTQFERMLGECNIDSTKRLYDIIAETRFWQPFRQHRLSQIRRSFNNFSDSVYSSTDDVAALLRCRGMTTEMGQAVVRSAEAKHALHNNLLHSNSLSDGISLLRNTLTGYTSELSQ